MPRIAIAMRDFAGAIATFRGVFGLPVTDFSDRTVPELGAHVAMCQPAGGSNIELMSPADPTKPLSQALQKFIDRRGDGLYALMLEAPDPNAEATALAARGLDVLPLMAGASGRDVHPRSTHGVLVRVYPNDSVRALGSYEPVQPDLTGIAKVIVATTDAATASETYGRRFGLDVGPVTTDAGRGVTVVQCRPPKGGLIELVSPADDSRAFSRTIAASLQDRGEGMFALVLQAGDPDAAAAILRSRGATLAGTGASGTGCAETTQFGARILIEASPRT